jgi:hypothetical protein
MVRVLDNFLDEDTLQEIIEDASSCLNNECYFAKLCYRSDDLTHIYEHIRNAIDKAFDINIVRMSLFKHPVENFPEMVTNPPQHIDRNSTYSGVLYLVGDIGMGTTIDTEYIEFEKNRIICFDGLTPHNSNFGGKDRIVLTFFGNKS